MRKAADRQRIKGQAKQTAVEQESASQGTHSKGESIDPAESIIPSSCTETLLKARSGSSLLLVGSFS